MGHFLPDSVINDTIEYINSIIIPFNSQGFVDFDNIRIVKKSDNQEFAAVLGFFVESYVSKQLGLTVNGTDHDIVYNGVFGEIKTNDLGSFEPSVRITKTDDYVVYCVFYYNHRQGFLEYHEKVFPNGHFFCKRAKYYFE